jgi:hypothetical protein
VEINRPAYIAQTLGQWWSPYLGTP